MAKRREVIVLDSVAEVFDELGGATAVAHITGRNRTTVCNWRSRNVCAASTYKVMIDALLERGVTAPASLWGQTKRRARAPSAKETERLRRRLAA